MTLDRTTVVDLCGDTLFPAFRAERGRLDKIDLWYRWQHEAPTIARRNSTAELRHLLDLARTPWLSLVVTTVAQTLYVDGYRSPDSPKGPEGQKASGPWRIWQANDLDTRQTAIHRAALAYGQSYVTAMPGDTGAVLRGVSPRKMLAMYADPAEDDWPMYAIRAELSGDEWAIRIYDEESVHFLSCDKSGADVQWIDRRDHNVGVCPVIRYANMLDLDGRADGEVEPFISLASRINKTTFDRLLTQHYSSWKVRTVSGMAQPETQEDQNRAKLQLRQDDILIAEDSDTKFGTLDETPLDGFIRAHDSDIEALAAVAQVPTTSLTGKVANLSAEAIAELRAGLTQKATERQKSFGKSHTQALRLASAIEGDADSAGDVMAEATWQDMQIRSLSQAVDALGKAAQMLQVPPQALWARIPGVTKSDVQEWEQMAASGDALGNLTRLLTDQSQPQPF